MMDGTFVEAMVESLQGPEVHHVNGRQYLVLRDGEGWKTAALEAPETEPGTVVIGTLSGLADYVKANKDALALAECMAHVVNHAQVDLVSKLTGSFRQRFTYIRAAFGHLIVQSSGFTFGQYLDSETFIVGLQTLFVKTKARDDVLALVGNIKESTVRQTEDDGVSQQVTGRAGAVLVAEIIVPNPVTLQPYRTFREIEQPESLFVLRLKSGPTEGKPLCALFEADGGTWRLEAVRRVRDWLAKELPEITILA